MSELLLQLRVEEAGSLRGIMQASLLSPGAFPEAEFGGPVMVSKFAKALSLAIY